MSEADPQPITELVAALYPALTKGDKATIRRIVADEFEGTLTEGLPLGTGGLHHGREAMIDNAWWTLGRAFHIRPEPSLWMPCPDGRLLVLGRYVGSARETGAPLDAAFVHLWSAAGGRLTAVWQLTDSALFVRALESIPE
jgi:2-(1,2-epoxy-1,2-dihydrophenyl)acetyl-CoA isomerase